MSSALEPVEIKTMEALRERLEARVVTISTACAGANRMPGYELRQALIDLAAIAEQIADELPAPNERTPAPR